MALSREYFTENGALVEVRRCRDTETGSPVDEVTINYQEFYAKDYFDTARFFIKRGLKILEDEDRTVVLDGFNV